MITRLWVESSRDKSELEKYVTGAGFKLDDKEPEMVITYGGDGSILQGEMKYPGIPKLPIRENRIYARCETYSIDQIPKILHKLGEGKYKTYEQTKVEACSKGRALIGLNEVQIHTKLPTHAVRFSIEANGKKTGELVGDGLVAATPHGSTAYFRSVGGKPFGKGIRIAFNNVWPGQKPVELSGVAIVRILRDRAWLTADNNQDIVELKAEDSVEIRQCESKAIFVKV
jgi:NAD+ kinase